MDPKALQLTRWPRPLDAQGSVSPLFGGATRAQGTRDTRALEGEYRLGDGFQLLRLAVANGFGSTCRVSLAVVGASP